MASVQSPPGDLRPTARVAWAPPAFVRYRYSAGALVFSTNLYATPTSPGTARVFLADASYPMPEGGLVDVFDGVVKKKEETKESDGDGADGGRTRGAKRAGEELEAAARPSPPRLLLLQRLVLTKVLSWFPFIRHWMQGTIFDGDGILLAGQAKRMASLEAADAAKRWPQLYYMPASCDVFVTQLRIWLDREAGGGPAWAPGVAAAAAATVRVAARLAPAWAALTRARTWSCDALEEEERDSAESESDAAAEEEATGARHGESAAATAAVATAPPFRVAVEPARAEPVPRRGGVGRIVVGKRGEREEVGRRESLA